MNGKKKNVIQEKSGVVHLRIEKVLFFFLEMSSKSFKEEVSRQNKLLDDIEESYSQWEEDLDQAEKELFEYHDLLDSIFRQGDDLPSLIDSLEANYNKISQKVSDLEKKYTNKDQSTVAEAKEIYEHLTSLVYQVEKLVDLSKKKQNGQPSNAPHNVI